MLTLFVAFKDGTMVRSPCGTSLRPRAGDTCSLPSQLRVRVERVVAVPQRLCAFRLPHSEERGVGQQPFPSQRMAHNASGLGKGWVHVSKQFTLDHSYSIWFESGQNLKRKPGPPMFVWSNIGCLLRPAQVTTLPMQNSAYAVLSGTAALRHHYRE